MIIYCLKCGTLIAGPMVLDGVPEVMRCKRCLQPHEVVVRKIEASVGNEKKQSG